MIALVASLAAASELQNNLGGSTSPYLRAHADNAVAWQPWGDEAFALAAELDVPVLLSVGFASCRYCWQMERESFKDPELAAFINTNFVSIKLDREERPDVDAIYSEAQRELYGRKAWPATLFLTSDGLPFDAGGYFPPVERGPLPAFRDRLEEVAAAWQKERDTVTDKATRLRRRLDDQARMGLVRAVPGPEALDAAVADLLAREDKEYGGWGQEKLPPGPALDLLLDVRSDDVLLRRTLDAVVLGGLHDHFGGGFFVGADPTWRSPQAEKSLADNAQLATIYADAWLELGDEHYADASRETLRWMLAELGHPQGGFSTRQVLRKGTHRWTVEQIQEVLPARREANRLIAAYHLDDVSVPWLESPIEEEMVPAVRAMRLARQRRPQEVGDVHRLSAWNGLAMTAMSRGAIAFDDPELAVAARLTAVALLEARDEQGRLPRIVGGPVRGMLDDYAFVVNGLIDLYTVDPNPRWLKAASQLGTVMVERFQTPRGGFYHGEGDRLARQLIWQDEAVPAGLGHAVLAVQRLHAYGAPGFDDVEHVDKTLGRAARYLSGSEAGSAFPTLLRALRNRHEQLVSVVIVGSLRDPKTRELAAVFQKKRRPGAVLAMGLPVEGFAVWEGKTSDTPRAWVCRGSECDAPTDDPRTLSLQLAPPPPASE